MSPDALIDFIQLASEDEQCEACQAAWHNVDEIHDLDGKRPNWTYLFECVGEWKGIKATGPHALRIKE